jgi:chromosomal replication initiation ATPase DnaA
MQSEGLHPIDRGQLPLELGHDASLGEDDLLVGEGNRLAYAHVLAWPDWAGPLTLLVGPPKAGKSHLARIFANRADAVVPEPEEIEALAGVGGATPLVIEDVDRVGYAESALFHLLNQSMRDRRPLLMTARVPVAEWPYRTDDVRSRARLAAQFSVEPAGDILLSQMFVKLFADRQVAVDPRVIAYLAARMERSPQEVVALVDLTDRLALARGTAITRAIAAEALRLRGGDNQLELNLEGEDDE